MVTLHFAWYLLHLAMFAFHLHGICHILASQPLTCMVFATFSCFKRSCGSLEGSLSFHLGFHLKFHFGFHLGIHPGLNSGFHLGFLQGFI